MSYATYYVAQDVTYYPSSFERARARADVVAKDGETWLIQWIAVLIRESLGDLRSQPVPLDGCTEALCVISVVL